MSSRTSILTLIFALALTATAAVRAGETTRESAASAATVPTVTVSAHPETTVCDGMSQDEARRIADQAKKDGAHRKAAECFRIAGDTVSADRAQLRASAETGEASSQKTVANVEVAKAQAKRIREAFRR